jgi:hypothetical protein
MRWYVAHITIFPPPDNFLFAVVVLRIESLASAAAPGLHRCRCAHAPSSIVLPIELLARHERSCPWPPLPHTSSLCSYARSRILWRQCCRCVHVPLLGGCRLAGVGRGSASRTGFRRLHAFSRAARAPVVGLIRFSLDRVAALG